ncbi:MAG: ATP-binding cassette domain-containing protein [Desulfosarcina sp.]|nr:ATP-binding cassette domain-containing protein [Desulfosarcina sp.]MBC2744304.1 ATP-binding cassette domain-containing protein [Desulfosarcina sp.]MBC2767213.1 ATP-binding cassette domain-containing protein [Desulfosarcina sp.]
MNQPGETAPIITLQNVCKRFVKSLDWAGKIGRKLGANIREEIVQAVDAVNLDIAEGEVVGLVGESGCGKSTLGRMVAGILPLSEGAILYRGKNVAELTSVDAGKMMLNVQMIFQDPFASLNPRKRVRDIIGEAPLIHEIVTRTELDGYVDEIMLLSGLDPIYKRRYPHQFSGGQRQRIGIARALAVKPEFIVCDEAVAALDVSIQAQILNLFMQLREELKLTYLFISHDLGVVEHISDRIVIMYLGRVVEVAATEELFARPNHPYTQALLQEVPRLETRQTSYRPITGEIPSPLDPPMGCHFHPRCPHVTDRCREQVPLLKEISPGRLSACHLNEAG